ncbi:hypothetical protein SISNIDRAFT_474054 [Sistotremastrum niveocremeum HHB9708]|uniref:C2 domain-containing protein n=1 Tax=Sistotremastrum niveocremeum HHB9708 TaxID=1314777 RepID=A0A164V9E0_9AGAM|nr:hypothetical protein SISNIDRAFT_474054 [Sistotremastrum niveocremeum HHB9708]
MAAHQYGQGYSERAPVPTIQGYQDDKAQAEKDLLQKHEIAETQKQSAGQSAQGNATEKSEIMDRMAGPKGKPTDKVKNKAGERVVKDPTTGQMVVIKDAEFKDYPQGDALAPESSKKGPATSVPETADSSDPVHTAPTPAHVGNISLLPFPPATPPSMKSILSHLDRLQIAIVAGCAIGWFFTAFGAGWWKFVFRSLLFSALGFGVTTLASLAQRELEKEMERIRIDMHRQRGEKYAPPTPESVEWLNAFIKTIWGLVNPDMFISITDMIEDVMQQSLPGFVDAVRISDVGQGTNPFRIISMRGLPDQPGDKEYPRQEWIDQGTNLLTGKNAQGQDTDQTGDYVNFEVAFSYQALPGQGGDLRAKNIHLLIEFFLGVYDWLHIPIPIWIQVEGIVATARVRLQFIPEFPYVRNLTFTLMGVPGVEVSAIPMLSKLPNILDLPLISRFVKMAIAAGTAEFVAPKSMTLNLQEIMSSAVIGDTRATGVFVIHIKHAEGLSAQDRNGRSDPYIVLAYAKFGKPLYSTRIIMGDLNPVFDETAFLLVSQDEVKAEEDLSAMLWDSDKRSADDLIGRVQIPVKELIKTPNVMFDRTDKLVGFEDADAMAGTLHWSIEMEIRPGDKAPNPAAKDLPPPPPDIDRTPPDPKYTSAILSIVVHQINNLERQNLSGTTGNREGAAGQDTDEPSEQGNNLPSAYCELVINDDLVYKTLREKDPILGIINLKLEELFTESSEITRLFSLQEGIGFGRANISLLLRPVKTDLPRSLRGWDTGTVELLSPVSVEIKDEARQHFSDPKKLTISTTDSNDKVPASEAEVLEEGRVTRWNLDAMRLPVYNRYSSSLTFEVGGGGIGRGKPVALAILWLQDIVDDEETDVRIPIVVGKDLRQLSQNVLNDFTAKTHDYTIAGYLTTRIKLDSGLDEDHEAHAKTQARRHAFETYDHIEGEAQIAEKNSHAMDDGVIDKDEKKAISRAHSRQLHNRQRGIAGFRPYRTLVWMKQGIKSRIIPSKKSTKRDPAVKSEAKA